MTDSRILCPIPPSLPREHHEWQTVRVTPATTAHGTITEQVCRRCHRTRTMETNFG